MNTVGLASSIFVNFVREFQTLIAGLIAIAAAYITVRPVWRQLDLMSIQTNTTLRDFLLDRIQVMERRRKWSTERLETLSNDLIPPLYEISGGHVISEWAFNQEQNTAKALGDMQQFEISRRDTSSIESVVAEIISALKIVKDNFEAIHRPESMDRSGEHYEISDQEWFTICEEGSRAESALPEMIRLIDELTMRLDHNFNYELNLLRERVQKIDLLLVKL